VLKPLFGVGHDERSECFEGFASKIWLLSRDRKSSEQFVCFNRRYHEMKAELALSGIVPSMMSEMNQEEAI
jgi:hypothetical protein